jgi:hypothetical protein
VPQPEPKPSLRWLLLDPASPHTTLPKLCFHSWLMSVPPGWVGACAPLLYIAQCSKKEIDTYVLASRVWIIPNALALISLVATFIRRCWLVKEGFNTVRLLLIKFMIGLPLYDTF